MDEMVKYLNGIPWTKKLKIKQEVVVYIGAEPHEVMVDTTIDYDNSETKLAAISRSDKLFDLEAKLKLKVFQERKEKKGNRRRLFEEELKQKN